MDMPLTGGCICGAVRFEVSADPLMMVKCHCRDCQQVSGGPYAPAILFPFNAFKLTKGMLQRFATPSLAGGDNVRGFCVICGSRLTVGENPDKVLIGVLASSLENPGQFKPQMDTFVSDAWPWDVMDQRMPKHRQYSEG